MALSEQVKQQLEGLIGKSDVVLFMKGNKHFPQCGFSSRVVKMLTETGTKFETVNVLSDPAIRDGIKEFSEWPTIPQLYIKKEFVGGCDIITEMFNSGELQKMLGVKEEPVTVPTITLAADAAKTILAAQEGEDRLRLEITADFQYDLYFAPPKTGDLIAVSAGVSVHFDKPSAKRANGLHIDFVDAAGGGAFKIENPNEPPKVKPLRAKELKAMLDGTEKVHLFDVRGDDEIRTAKIAGSKVLDASAEAEIAGLPKDAKIVFQCHHGMRSRAAAERFLKDGFRNIFNLEGGIDAWSLDVDSSVPRY